jgi:hypothetical protein
MAQVLNDHAAFIEKSVLRQLERHAVLQKVDAVFRIVPFEDRAAFCRMASMPYIYMVVIVGRAL